MEEAQTELSSLERQSNHRYNELETRHNALQGTVEELRADVDAKVNALKTAQQKLSQKEEEAGQLENEVVRLKTQTGDADSLALVKRELSEQVAHIRKLEATNREYQAELRQLRKQQKSVEVVEEEKRTLEGKVRMMNDLRKELAEAQLQRQILEDERKAWTAYLESQASKGELNFDSPEDMARAFVRERLEVASLMERLGGIQPELAVKEENIKSLEDEKAKLLAEVEKLRNSGGPGDSKLRSRLERQRTLAVKEVEYLRAQLKAFDAEESEFHAESYDEQKTKQIQELENMVDEYRKELQTLHTDLSAAEARLQNPEAPPTGTKRRRDSNDDERLGELRRKNRQLQDDLSTLHTRNTLLETDLKALESQLAALKASSRTRILELRSNPTADAEALKMRTLDRLREENRVLLERLEDRLSSASGNEGQKLVPLATLELARMDVEEARAALASAEKRTLRLKQVFASKSKEFRDAVASILGWKLEFRPNGRVKATSVFYPGGGGEDDEEGEEHFIEFDGEKGTMKVSGGPQSEFAKEIRGVIEEWVERRKEIPCFLAALTLEFWERSRGENI